MNSYLSELNAITENVFNSKGQQLDSLYAKIIEGKERGIDFIQQEPSINHIKKEQLSDEKKLLYEHCDYLVNLKNEAKINNLQFSMNIEDDIKRTLRLLYEDQRREEYFGKVERRNVIYYVFTNSIVDFVIEKATINHLELVWHDQKINAKNFIQVWSEYYQNLETSNFYDFNKEYTQEIIGYFNNDVGNENNSKLLGYLIKNLGPELNIYREDKFSDVSFYSKHKFKEILSLQYEKEDRKNIFETSEYKWWSQCMISLEHENNYLMAYEEMMYLTTRRARLKVLVTYYDNDDFENTRIIFSALCENFSSIIRQSNLLFNENEKTEYLLIVGSKLSEKEGQFTWNMQAFNWSGQWTEKMQSTIATDTLMAKDHE